MSTEAQRGGGICPRSPRWQVTGQGVFQILMPTPKTVMFIFWRVGRAALPQLQQVTGTPLGRQSAEARPHLSCHRMAAVVIAQGVGQSRPDPPQEGREGHGEAGMPLPRHLLTAHRESPHPSQLRLLQRKSTVQDRARRGTSPSSVPGPRSYGCHCTWASKGAAWGPETWVPGLPLL